MAIHFKYLFILGVVFMYLSCTNEKSVEPYENDRGSYTLQVTPTSIRSYRGGGGVFILSMTPSEDFEGKVLLSVVADPALGAGLFNKFLTSETRVAEVTIRPDTTAAAGIDTISVIHTHAAVSDTLTLEVEIVVGRLLVLPRDFAIARQDEFVTWLQSEHPELGIEMGQDWFGYFKYPGWVGASTWIFLNSRWEMTVDWSLMASEVIWLILRKRGEAEPSFAAKKEPDGTIHEVPVSEFISRWDDLGGTSE